MRIHRLTLATGDIAGQSAFWGGTLDLPVRGCAGGEIEIALQASMIRFEQASPGTDPRYHFAINIPRGSIEQAAAWIEERHELLSFHGDPDEAEGATDHSYSSRRLGALLPRCRRQRRGADRQ